MVCDGQNLKKNPKKKSGWTDQKLFNPKRRAKGQNTKIFGIESRRVKNFGSKSGPSHEITYEITQNIYVAHSK